MVKSCFLLLLCLLLSACESENSTAYPQKPSIPVVAVKPQIKNIPIYIESIGTLQPFVHIDVRPQLSGILQEVLIKEGDQVNRDQPLFKMDPLPYLIQLQQAEAQLQADYAQLQSAQKKLARFQKLKAQDLIAQTEWDELEAQVSKAEAHLAMNEAKLAGVKLDLEHCIVSSPTQGRVGKLDIYPGTPINPQSSLVSISQMDPLKVEFFITQKEFLNLNSSHQSIEIQALCHSNSNNESVCDHGTLTFLDNQFDPKSGLLLVRGKLANSENRWRAGQNIKVRVPISTTEEAMLIPQKAIRYNEKGPYVYVVKSDNTAVVCQLTLGEEQKSDVIIKEGLDPSDLIVTEGYLRLSPGAKVEVKS